MRIADTISTKIIKMESELIMSYFKMIIAVIHLYDSYQGSIKF